MDNRTEVFPREGPPPGVALEIASSDFQVLSKFAWRRIRGLEDTLGSQPDTGRCEAPSEECTVWQAEGQTGTSCAILLTMLWDEPGLEALTSSPTRYSFQTHVTSLTGKDELDVEESQDNSADYPGPSTQIAANREIARLFGTFEPNGIEDETRGVFTEQLGAIVKEYGGMALNEMHHLIINEKVGPDAAEAALCVLGDIDDPGTHNYRRWLLEQVLVKSASPIARDGASLGLSYMDDPCAIPHLKEAIEHEDLPLMRKLLGKTLAQLEETQGCRSSCT